MVRRINRNIYMKMGKENEVTFLAMYPSSQSVMAAAMKILVVAVLPHQQST